MREKHEENLLSVTENNPLPLLPPSASSSPSHEFSFTISLHPSAPEKIPEKTKNPSSFAIDLSPADDIFFHGHLLPLHLLSHLPVSPRSSTNSLDSFTLPIKELESINTISSSTDGNIGHNQNFDAKGRAKAKSFSLFSLSKWRKGEKDDKERQKKKLKFDVSQVLKRYARMVRPLLSFKSGNKIHRQSYSFSGNLRVREKPKLRGRRGEFSAPASMITSPTNSGLLVATGTLTPTTQSDSTMEELQSAIQAAIAHCKKSIAVDEKIKSHE
ncbi:BRI1 kinase inhibitor 1 [Abeliophyllum distichum]|uniref:BRI1 kinase inhibitor 1 n=1 Tax=Abeliophyllum distichum TaxID=126358 RepID=A0ABD1SC66_9LAMI